MAGEQIRLFRPAKTGLDSKSRDKLCLSSQADSKKLIRIMWRTSRIPCLEQ